MRVTSVVAVPALLAAFALPAPAGAKDGPESAAVEPEVPAAAPASGEASTVPASAGPGEAGASPVPAVGGAREEPAEEIAGPTGAVPALAVPGADSTATAGASAADRHVLSLAPEVVVPFGDWADVSRTGLGLGVAYEYRATERWAFTGRTGYVVHLENERKLAGVTTDLHTHEVPLLAGVRYAPLPRFYGALEAGLVHFRQEAEVGPDVETGGGFRLGGSVGAGYRLDRFDVGARLFLPDLVGRDEGESLSTGFSLQAGYEFAGF